MSILIVGGAGYIGSQANKYLCARGYETVVLDNLVTGHRELATHGTFIEGDLGDREVLQRIFSAHKIDAVMHFAAFACVGESVTQPSLYYENNFSKTLILLEEMMRHNIFRFVFSSTCATFGDAKTIPIHEQHPQNPVNPYGRTKLMVEQALRDFDHAYGMKSCVFRYFNAAGADADAEIGEWHLPETHLIPIVLDVAVGKRAQLEIFGDDYETPDGTCVRDYIHVIDLAAAHHLGLERLMKTATSDDYNLGCGTGHSIREVVKTAEQVTGRAIPCVTAARRDGDPPVLIGSSEKAQKLLGWNPQFSLADCIATAWKWHQKLP